MTSQTLWGTSHKSLFPDVGARAFGASRGVAEAVIPLVNRHPHRKFRPLTILLIGRRGQGKTLLMTYLAAVMQERYRRSGKPSRVFSNYWTSFADLSTPFIFDAMLDPSHPQYGRIQRGLLCVDEIQTAAASRRAMAGINLSVSGLLTQIRKRQLEVLFTTQFPQVLDQQVLIQTDLFLECSLVAGGRGVQVLVHDFWGQWTGNNERKPWPPRASFADWTRTYWGTDKMFGHYDTDEFIVSMYMDQDKRAAIMEKEWEAHGHTITPWEEPEVAPLTEEVIAPKEGPKRFVEQMKG